MKRDEQEEEYQGIAATQADEPSEATRSSVTWPALRVLMRSAGAHPSLREFDASPAILSRILPPIHEERPLTVDRKGTALNTHRR